jgi:Skp family chaperone for outer membrane proteins
MDQKTTRGRKKTTTHSIETLDMSKYIQTVLKTIDGVNYLIDEHGVIYRFDTYEITGQVVENNIKWF